MKRTLAVRRVKPGEDHSLADFYRNMSPDERMENFLQIQKNYLVAMGYTHFPRVERVIQFRKMNCH
jgi:hypothetical protein